jgi:hypothetical protein
MVGRSRDSLFLPSNSLLAGPNPVFALGTLWLAKVLEILYLRLRMTDPLPAKMTLLDEGNGFYKR